MTCLTCARSHSAQNAVSLGRHAVDVPTEADIAAPREQIPASELTVAHVSCRGSHQRSGAKAGRTRSESQRSWEVDLHLLAGMP
jgi:hypothetical protein